MDAKRVYLGFIDMIMLEMVKSAEIARDSDIEEAESQAHLFDQEVIEEDKKIACEEYCNNVDEIKEACQELKHLISYWI